MLIDNIEEFVRVYNDIESYTTIKNVGRVFAASERSVRRMADRCRKSGIKLVDRAAARKNVDGDMVVEKVDDIEIVKENIRLAKQLQKVQDQNRIKNKSFRDDARVENAIEELDKELIRLLNGFKLSTKPKYHASNGNQEYYGIVHWSDTHLNEQIDLPWNKFNWTVGAKRLQKHVQVVKKMCKAFGIHNVLVAMTGDMLNSDRRMDEIVSNAGNRAQACMLAVDLYQQALLDLNEDLNVTVAAISGNESRIPYLVGWDKLVASENYDFVISEMLKRLLDSKGIRFFNGTDPSEVVVNLGGQNVLLLHGHGSIDHKAPLKTVQQLKGRYMAHGVPIDFVIFGHVHEALIGDYYARSSSLVGTNDYSEKALGLSGRASQNFYVLSSVDKGFHGMKIDLQDTNGIEGYNIQTSLESYNTKSAIKAEKTVVVQTVVL